MYSVLQFALAILALSPITMAQTGLPPETIERLATTAPSESQLDWQSMEFTAFVHFGVNTFTDREWGTGTEDPRLFHPTDLDTDQWCRSLAENGFKLVIITAKHHDGFCLWPTRHTRHSVASSDWRDGHGDVLADLAASCRKHGLKIGFYLSPADLYQMESEPGPGSGLYGNESQPRERIIPTPVEGARPFTSDKTFRFTVDDYNAYFLNQLYELLTEYGDVAEIWFDGAHPKRKGGQQYAKPLWERLIRELQPGIIIHGNGFGEMRWVGNELGFAREQEWSVVPEVLVGRRDPPWMDADLGSRELIETLGADEFVWLPAETDVSIRPGWFYHASQDDQVKSDDHLFKIYLESIGRNSTLLLNYPPDRRGHIHENDVAATERFTRRLREALATDLAEGARITATHAAGGHEADAILDSDPETYWTTDPWQESADLTLDLERPATFNLVVLQEHVRAGQRIERFRLQRQIDGQWRDLAAGTTVGYKRVLKLPRAVTASHLRVRIEASRYAPTLDSLSLHLYDDTVHPPEFFASRGLLAIRAPTEVVHSSKGHALPETIDSADYVIRYTTDGSEVTEHSPIYTRPLDVTSGTIRARCFLDARPSEEVVRRVEPLLEAEIARENARMDWWREARFGLFVHWGLYAIPAGEWNGVTTYGEWIRHSAQIPIDTYDRFVDQFNPVNFDADAWVLAAKGAGMKYIVITSKHHDGFALFDSAVSDFDVMATPFDRDILEELADACRRHGLKMCWYHSIMDWHNPDYLPRRPWEADDRPAGDADLDRYVAYMKTQLRELITRYGPIGVLWFDGEWESTWSHERGEELYDYVRSLQPDIIVNNRVDVGRGGMAGMTKDRSFAGDFGTPEQEVPATGFPGVDWESCITMNANWGYNSHDTNYKSTEHLVRMLVDIVSKGGNLLLNVGPKADGTFPDASIERLRQIGDWMHTNSESVYGTQASPFADLAWGRCTSKRLDNGNTRLYLHVFDWPPDARLVVPGIFNAPAAAHLLADPDTTLRVSRLEDALVIDLPERAPDEIDTVVALDVVGRPDISVPPEIMADAGVFIDTLDVHLTTDRAHVTIRYTTDDSAPTPDSPLADAPIRLTQTATVRARAFRDGRAVSAASAATFTRVTPRPAAHPRHAAPGLRYEYFEGEWDALPDFDALAPVKSGEITGFEFTPRDRPERFAFRYTGFIEIPRDGVYRFTTTSDDGSRLSIGDRLVVDNDGLHGAERAEGRIALAAGRHPITVTYFERTGGDMLEVRFAEPGADDHEIPLAALTHEP